MGTGHLRRIQQITTYDDPAMVAAWRRASATRASYLAEPTARMLDLTRIAPGHRVLVVGTGIGEEALAAATRVGAAGEVVAIDVSAAMTAEAIRSVATAGASNVRCLVMDAQDLKFRPSTFDAVISRNTLMFIPDLTLALSEMNRVLKWKGRIAATVWASARRNPRLSGPLEAAQALGVRRLPTATFRIALRLGAPSLLATALRAGGFSEVAVERWPVVARYETVTAAVEQAMDHVGTRELMELISRDSERRMSRSLAQRWQKYVVQAGVNLPGEQLVAAGAKLRHVPTAPSDSDSHAAKGVRGRVAQAPPPGSRPTSQS
ncbi:MAG: methyltransferase domain-containing protein [Candidatus Dormiibacterota bacterium]